MKFTEEDKRSPIARFGLWFFGFLLIAISPLADTADESLLEPGMNSLQYLYLLIWLVMLVIGLACVYAAWTFAK